MSVHVHVHVQISVHVHVRLWESVEQKWFIKFINELQFNNAIREKKADTITEMLFNFNVNIQFTRKTKINKKKKNNKESQTGYFLTTQRSFCYFLFY